MKGRCRSVAVVGDAVVVAAGPRLVMRVVKSVQSLDLKIGIVVPSEICRSGSWMMWNSILRLRS
jgi:hypothetical protein